MAQPVRAMDAAFHRDLEARVRTSRQLGARADLVLHGGGNTSVKTTAQEVTGEPVDVLCVKGSGSDLAGIDPSGFAVCRLEPLRRMAALPSLSDTDMVQGLRSHMLNPSGPTPSVEALLHAIVPGKFVDHTHADAALVVLDQPDAEQRARELWGEGVCFVPYIMPGFVLARALAERHDELGQASLVALEKHGLFTWGDSAEESYDRMIAAVARAEDYVRTRLPSTSIELSASQSKAPAELRQRLASLLRGAVGGRRGGPAGVVTFTDDAAIVDLASNPRGRELTVRGPITPDHVIRTKPWPLWLEVSLDSDDEALRAAIDAALSDYASAYHRYFTDCSALRDANVTELDRLPRVVVVPGVGAFALTADAVAARIATDLFSHTARVVSAAERLGRYTPVTAPDLFDVEYWSLEQAKLGKKGTPLPLAGRVALVTGAASGIGLRTSELFAEQGAHVLLVDRDASVHEAALALGRRTSPARVLTWRGDLLDPSAAQAAVATAVDAWGGLDIVVSNAGTAPDGLLHEPAGASRLESSLEMNLLSHQRLARAATEVLLRQGIGGCLLFNASKSAFNQGPKFGPYAVAKAGLIALMRQYAIDLGAFGVRSNAVNADRIRTALFAHGVLEARAEARGVTPDAYFRENLLRRETTAEDVARAFLWLATAEATTGSVVTVDGGNSAAFPR